MLPSLSDAGCSGWHHYCPLETTNRTASPCCPLGFQCHFLLRHVWVPALHFPCLTFGHRLRLCKAAARDPSAHLHTVGTAGKPGLGTWGAEPGPHAHAGAGLWAAQCEGGPLPPTLGRGTPQRPRIEPRHRSRGRKTVPREGLR